MSNDDVTSAGLVPILPPHSSATSTPPFPSTLRSPAPGPTFSSSQSSASCAPIAQLTSFSSAHDFVIKDSQFIDISLGRPGIDKLLKVSMPKAFHNSAARCPPPKCHLGTRNDYISIITNWADGNSDHEESILWMRGPFGIGKSAVAQSCAEALHCQNKLAATLFFSRSNADRDDPQRVFTSIAYQIATISPHFRDIVDMRIRDDPALATKSLSTQFEELLTRPLSQVDIAVSGIDGRVVIIDGLDECRGSSEQCEIIRIIAASARARTTPFRWFITSRPEDPIIRTMKSPTIIPISFHLELPVSHEIDHEILLYLTDEFKKIRESHGLAESWPSEEVLTFLVDRTAGLWIYIATIIRFITDENSLGPEDQLRIVIEFAKSISVKVGPDNPLAEMDFFYTLIIQRIPENIQTIVRKILLVNSVAFNRLDNIASALGLSEDQFRRSCTFIKSVLELQGDDFQCMTFHFYHASFLDFMKDPARSKELCIHDDFLAKCRIERLDWLHQVCSRSAGPEDIIFPSVPILFPGWTRAKYYYINLACFWRLFGIPNHSIDLRTAGLLEKIPFRMMLHLMGDREYRIPNYNNLRNNLPTEFRDKIISKNTCPTPGCKNTVNVFIWGNEIVVECTSEGHLNLKDNQHPHPGQCFCGSQITSRWGSRFRSISTLLRSLSSLKSTTQMATYGITKTKV